MELDSEASTSQGPALPSTSSPRSNGAASGAADVEGGKGRGSGKASGRARGKGRDKGKGRGQRDGQDGAAADGAGLTLVEKLALSPYSSELHLASIAAATSDDEREEARAFMAQMVPLTEEQWLEWIKDRKLQVGTSLEGKIGMLELYKRACSDSLSIKLHQEYAQFVLSIFFGARGYAFPEVLQEEESTPDGALFDEGAAPVFDEEFVDGEMLAAVDQSVRWHLAEGQSVWLTLHNYEIFRLKHAPTEEAVSRMEQVYLERLSEPHLQISQTHQLYSTFISTYKNRDYEESMVASQPIYAASKALVDVRELQEDRLASASLSVESYQTYLAWEQEVAKPHFLLVKVLYERALNQFSHDTSLWQAYTTFLLTASRRSSSVTGVEDSGWSPDMLLEVYNRAVRWLPFAGQMISACMMGTELLYGVETALAFGQEQYDRVIGANETGMTLEDLTSVVIAYADSVRHAELELAEEARPTSQLVTVLESGIAKVRSLAPDTGDAHMRIEKYLLRQYERSGNTTAVDALLASLAQSYATSAVVLVTRTEYLLRQNKVDVVRKLFQAAAKKRYDYPEFVFDAWANFEHRDGTLATLDKALATIKHEMTFVEARRLRENRLQLAASDEIHIEQEGSQPAWLDTSSGQDVSSKKRRLGGDPAEGIAVGASAAIDVSNNGSSTKQGAFLGMCMTIEVRVLTKLVRKEEVLPHELKRDRENSTISVTGLSLGVDEDAIKRLFRDCGAIREVKSKVINDRAVATVEFVNRDSVPAALTKDKKRIEGHEVQVSPVWQSTLYVTNFPEQFDAADVQKLFEPFGTIFETRWPSRRLKSTRRFVYVQYTEADAAQKALALHNTVVEEGSDQRLQVKISDPQHKQARTDANATKRELYVTGLPRSATESDLEKLFAPFGALRACRVLKDDNGQCRGAGFVDFETEQSTSAALSMNNHEFKKRRLAVVLADSRLTQKAKVAASGQGQRADTRNRSIKATGFPLDAQEPLVQQFFDRYGPTTVVELQGETAVVTFANPADAAKLLLGASQVDYEGHAVTLEEPRTRANRESADHKGLPPPAGVVPFLPRANRGRGRKLGIGARRPTHGMDVDPVNNADKRVGNIPVQGDASQSKNRSQADFKALLLSKNSS